MLLNCKITAVDFDGTLCESKWPDIGAPNHEVINYIKDKKKAGEKIILWTCRTGDKLQNALEWCKGHGLEFDAVNDNVPEINDMFPVDGRKIYYDELVDDKHCTLFDLPYSREKGSCMRSWAKREIEIASHRERANCGNDKDDWDYGVACYDSALKAYNSLCKDSHSGYSIVIAKHILNRLIDVKPLTPIEDTPDVWQLTERSGSKGYKCYQCSRMSSLFKYIYDDGSIRYKDVDNHVCHNIYSNSTYHSGLVQGIIDELYPIAMPYYPGKKMEVYCEDFLVNPKNGDFDTFGVFYLIDSKGNRVDVNQFYKESKDGWKRISRLEYILRKSKKVKE